MKCSKNSVISPLCLYLITIFVSGSIVYTFLNKNNNANGIKKSVIIEWVESSQLILRIPATFLSLAYIVGHKVDQRVPKNVKLLTIAALKIILSHVCYFLIDGFELNVLSIAEYISTNLPLLIINIVLLQWFTKVYDLKLRLSVLNNKLQRLKYENRHKGPSKILPHKVPFLRHCGMIYGQLCDEGQELNAHFSWQILSIIPLLFLLIVHTSFQACQMIQHKLRFESKAIVFNLLYFEAFLELIVPCVMVQKEGEHFVDNLHKIDGPDLDRIEECCYEEEVIALQTYHEKFVFSAHGLFPLDGTLIYSIFGALTTYLVILLQFDL